MTLTLKLAKRFFFFTRHSVGLMIFYRHTKIGYKRSVVQKTLSGRILQFLMTCHQITSVWLQRDQQFSRYTDYLSPYSNLPLLMVSRHFCMTLRLMMMHATIPSMKRLSGSEDKRHNPDMRTDTLTNDSNIHSTLSSLLGV